MTVKLIDSKTILRAKFTIRLFSLSNCSKLRNLTHFTLRGHELSPVKHLYLKEKVALERSQKVAVLDKFVDKVRETDCFSNEYYECYVYSFIHS